MGIELILFTIFAIGVFVFLIVDLGIFQTKAHRIPFKQAYKQTIALFIAAYFPFRSVWLCCDSK